MKAEDGEDEAKGSKKGKGGKKAKAKAKAKAKGKAKVKASPKTKPKVAKVVTPGQNNEEVEPHDAKGKGKGKGKGKRQQRAEESHKGNGKGRGKSKKVKTGQEDDPDNTRGGNELGQDLSESKDAEDRKREQEQQEKIEVPKDANGYQGKGRKPTKTEPNKQKKQPPKNSQATPEEKGNGGPATFARRKCPETSYGKAKWEALKAVFLDIIKPKLVHYSAHEVGVDL